MNVEELKQCVRAALATAFPSYTVQIAAVAENPGDLAVSVFGVDRDAVHWVKDKILDLDEELCVGTKFALTPLVRDLTTTRKFYPQHISPWTVVNKLKQTETIAINDCEIFVLQEDVHAAVDWVSARSTDECLSAANEELALAA